MQIKTRHQTSFHTELGDTGFIPATHFHNIFFWIYYFLSWSDLKKGQRFYYIAKKSKQDLSYLHNNP